MVLDHPGRAAEQRRDFCRCCPGSGLMTTGPGNSSAGYPGQQDPADDASQFNQIQFLIRQAMRLISVGTLVQVKAVTSADEVAATKFVDVQPLVKLIAPDGTVSSHGIVHGLPYFRLEIGLDAIICDPKVDDIGLAVFADRDISSVKKNRAESNPGSYRRFGMADGCYLGQFLALTPTQYLRFRSDGVELVDKNGNSIVTNADGITLTDKSSNTIVMDSDGIKINGVLFDRSQNVT